MSGDISIYPNPANDLLYVNLPATVIPTPATVIPTPATVIPTPATVIPTPATVMLNLFQHPTITLTILLGQSFSPPIIPAPSVIPAHLWGSYTKK